MGKGKKDKKAKDKAKKETPQEKKATKAREKEQERKKQVDGLAAEREEANKTSPAKKPKP